MGKYAALGFQFAAAILLFGFIGQWADRRLGTTPWGLMIGVGIGFFGGIMKLYGMAKDMEKEPPAGDDGEAGGV